MKNTCVIIMAGGVGSRFWPLSRTHFPKQFIDIFGSGKTLIQQTYERSKKLVPPQNIFVVTQARYIPILKEQIPELSQNQIIAEPISRNTAPCIAYASYKISKILPSALAIVVPSDHIILKEDAFVKIIGSAIKAANSEEVLITLGIKPDRPDTGYGYIQFMEGKEKIKKVKTFTEKPHLELAKTFIKSGDFLWNSGIFIWSVKSIIHSFEKLMPDLAEVFSEGLDVYNTDEEEKFIKKSYSLCRNISIDFGIMEKADNTYVIPCDIGWSDLGTWLSLYQLHQKDSNNNAVDGNMILLDTQDCIVKTPGNKLTLINGLKNYIVVESEGILLICKKDDEQKIKEFVAAVREKKGEKYM